MKLFQAILQKTDYWQALLKEGFRARETYLSGRALDYQASAQGFILELKKVIKIVTSGKENGNIGGNMTSRKQCIGEKLA